MLDTGLGQGLQCVHIVQHAGQSLVLTVGPCRCALRSRGARRVYRVCAGATVLPVSTLGALHQGRALSLLQQLTCWKCL